MDVLLYTLLWLACYFAPAAIASHRKHHQWAAIAALNLLLGWTVIGWIAAFVWALTAVDKQYTSASAA